jgi:hypothetical protein
VRRGSTVVLLTLALGGAGCALLLGIEDKPVVSPDAAASSDPCVHVLPPEPPPADDEGPTLPRFVVATRLVELEAPDGGRLGFDLDNTCTCAPADAGPTCKSSKVACDQPGGIDNAFASLDAVQLLNSTGQLGKRDIDCGRSTFLAVITGYNGRANDPTIALSPVISAGITIPHDAADQALPPPCNDGFRGRVTVYPPRWDGTDQWNADADSFYQDQPNIVLGGYVRDWTLVATAKSGIATTLALGSVIVLAQQQTFVADLEPLDANGRSLPRDPSTVAAKVRIRSGQVVGRLNALSILQAMTNIQASGGISFCPDNPLYQQIKADLCANLDMAEHPADDPTGQADCEAISIAAHFVGEPAIMAPAIKTPDAGASSCTTAVTDCKVP